MRNDTVIPFTVEDTTFPVAAPRFLHPARPRGCRIQPPGPWLRRAARCVVLQDAKELVSRCCGQIVSPTVRVSPHSQRHRTRTAVARIRVPPSNDPRASELAHFSRRNGDERRLAVAPTSTHALRLSSTVDVVTGSGCAPYVHRVCAFECVNRDEPRMWNVVLLLFPLPFPPSASQK